MCFRGWMPGASRCAQLLDRGRPDALVEVVRHLTLLQLDPTTAIAPNADLVAWTRLASYSPAELTTALRERKLVRPRPAVRNRQQRHLTLMHRRWSTGCCR